MPAYRIFFDREVCIGAAACNATCPEFWTIQPDGKSALKGSKQSNGSFVLDIEGKDLACNKNAAESCPVNAIHIFELKNGKQLI